jgi:thiamine pyrophosphokinase
VRTAVVVASAPWRWRTVFVEMVRAADLVLAADGGANHLARIGVRPHAVVGDLDSVLPDVRRWVGEERVVLRRDQEHTDLDKTLAYAFEEAGAEAVTVLAATGGRLDHALENLALLARWAARGPLELRDGLQRVVPVVDRATLPASVGQTVSLMPLGGVARVWSGGLRWELAGEPLDLLGRTSVSNVAERESIEVRVEGGALLVFLAEPAAEE